MFTATTLGMSTRQWPCAHLLAFALVSLKCPSDAANYVLVGCTGCGGDGRATDSCGGLDADCSGATCYGVCGGGESNNLGPCGLSGSSAGACNTADGSDTNYDSEITGFNGQHDSSTGLIDCSGYEPDACVDPSTGTYGNLCQNSNGDFLAWGSTACCTVRRMRVLLAYIRAFRSF